MEKKKSNNKNILKKFLIIILVAILISLILVVLNTILKKDKTLEVIENDDSIAEKNVKTERMEKLEELQKENSDIIGWLEIEDTNINYPVLQTDNNDFYMNHNYKKEYLKDGSIFLDKDYNWDIPSSNLLIYGHNNIGSKEMFASLENYKNEDFYKEHKIIRFTTNSEDAEFEIIAVFLSRVYYKSEKNVFRYYYFINAKTEEEYNDYVKNSKDASLYNIEATAKYGDQLLTLSTCSYHTEDGRLAVVARKK